jgi:tRNA(Arg) A34 adenosine deaminase TadA
MPTIEHLFRGICNSNPGRTIAAYTVPTATPAPGQNLLGQSILQPGAVLHYRASPAGCNSVLDVLDELTPGSSPIYTNIAPWRPGIGAGKHWLEIFCDRRLVIIRPNTAPVAERPWHAHAVTQQVNANAIRELGNFPPIRGAVVTGPLNLVPVIPGGGLFQAAQSMSSFDHALSGRMKGLQRALRYYQLAAYALVARANTQAPLDKLVGAILVNDVGNILAWGANAGGWRHAELNLIRAWHRRHNATTLFDDRTMLFSTLTPCGQCSCALADAKPARCELYYGQVDDGDLGSIGREISAEFDYVGPKLVKVGAGNNDRVLADQLYMAAAAGPAQQRALALPWYQRAETDLRRKRIKLRAPQDEEQVIKRDVLGHIVRFLDPPTNFRAQ